MLLKTITYKDYRGNMQTEEFAFHLNSAELLELRYGKRGGLENYLKRVINEQDSHEMLLFIKDIIKRSVGRVSDDGRQFIKSQEVRDSFMQTEAYPTLFLELAGNVEKMSTFVRAIIPSDLSEKVTDEDVKAELSRVELAKQNANIAALR